MQCERSRVPQMSISQICALIENNNIKEISFDLVDTLLVRPSIIPKDVLMLPEDLVKRKYGLSFMELRYFAEEEAGDEFITLDKLWHRIAKKHKLDSETGRALMHVEMQLERDMLTVRRDTKQLYDAAVRSGKRIIVVSDMYLPSDFLRDVLAEHGFDQISRVYVSCEEKARKNDGRLYEGVLEKEGLEKPSELLHIGDNFLSDYKEALEKGITAVYYPSVWELTMGTDSPWGMLRSNSGFASDPKLRLLYSFAMLHAWNKNDRLLHSRHYFPDIEAYADLLLAPMLTDLGIQLLTDPQVQGGYDTLYFAARDGFLPQKVYDILGKSIEHIPSRYLYVSRQALCYAAFQDFSDYFMNSRWYGKEFLLKDFLFTFILDSSIREHVLESLTEEEKSKNLREEFSDARKALARVSDELEEYFSAQKKLSSEYYRAAFAGKTGRQIVFDCGYSGSVSTGLMKAVGLPVDKYYLWEKGKENQPSDAKNRTRTVCYFKGDPLLGFNIIFEECLAPPDGSCLGFTEHSGEITPVLENLNITEGMCADMRTLERCCTAFAEDFERTFGSYLSTLRTEDHEIFLDIAKSAFLTSPYNELNIFDQIFFPDSHGISLSLSKKTYEIFGTLHYYSDSFHGTAFDNPDMFLDEDSLKQELTKECKIGIHLHLYNKYLIEEIISYLKTITHPFDLYITITDAGFEPVLKNLCTSSIIPSLKKLTVKLTRNRGRDVAPWVVEMAPLQGKYDYFCHIHGKESAHYGEGFGDRWRHYLYDNLIEGEAVNRILAFFENDEKLGLLFPRCFSGIRDVHNSLRIPVSGDYGEEYMIMDLLRKMGFSEYYARDNYIFSAGTMLWYRPNALEPLFSLGLDYDDFPEEPIPVGGTLAHAIERIPSIVAKNTGFKTAQFNHVHEQMIERAPDAQQYFNNSMDQIALTIGVKNSLAAVYHAHMIYLEKKTGIKPGHNDTIAYNTAKNIGVKNAWTVLRKACGIYIFKG